MRPSNQLNQYLADITCKFGSAELAGSIVGSVVGAALAHNASDPATVSTEGYVMLSAMGFSGVVNLIAMMNFMKCCRRTDTTATSLLPQNSAVSYKKERAKLLFPEISGAIAMFVTAVLVSNSNAIVGSVVVGLIFAGCVYYKNKNFRMIAARENPANLQAPEV